MNFEKVTQENGKHYLYQHIRLDKNEPFYVGIGTKYNHDKDYTRAKATASQRSSIWRGIVSRTEYKVIILHENNDYNIIKQLEIDYIAKFGQIIYETGSLCNITKGGDGKLGYRNKKKLKQVYIYKKTGEFFKEFEANVDCARFLKVGDSCVNSLINKNYLLKGFILKSYKTDKVEPIKDIREKLREKRSKKVYQYSKDMILIKEWYSTEEASRELKISGGHIRECAIQNKTANGGKNLRLTAGGFKWFYEKIKK